MQKNAHTLLAQIQSIGELQKFSRRNKPDFSKIMVGLKTVDNQVLFCEVRNSNIQMLRNINEGDVVTIEYIFAGSIKNNKQYNNIFITNLQRA